MKFATREEEKIWQAIDQRVPHARAWKSDEHRLQAHIVKHADLLARTSLPLLRFLHAIPNGGGRSKAEAGRLKAEGVKPGVSDLSLPVPAGKHVGLYMELKKAGGRVSPEQTAWLLSMSLLGHRAVLVNDPATAIRILTDYLHGRG